MMNKIFAVTAFALAIATPQLATAIPGTATTPLSSPIVIQGTSGGSQLGDCGYIASQPAQRLEVSESFAALQFNLESAGSPTLLIEGQDGHYQCIMADRLSGGRIDVEGIWQQNLYSIYVGDRNGDSYPFVLTISAD